MRFLNGRRFFLHMLALSTALVSIAWAAALTVIVVDQSGNPVRGARVSTWKQSAERAVLADRQTVDDEGIARLSFSGNAPLLLSVAGPGFVRDTRVVKEDLNEPLRIVLSRGRAIRLVVTDAGSGLPISRFDAIAVPADSSHVSADRLEFMAEGFDLLSFSDAEGKAILTGFGEDPVLLMIRSRGYAPAVVPHVDPHRSTPVRIELDSEGCRELQVVDRETGVPIEGAHAGASPEVLEGPLSRIAVSFVSDEHGYMTVCPLGRAVDRLLIEHPSYAPGQISTSDLPSEGPPEATIALGPGGVISGTIEDSDGLPIVNAVVETQTLGFHRMVRTGEDGGFVLNRLAPGMVDVVVSSAPEEGGSILFRKTVEVVENETAQLVVNLGTEFRVRVTREDVPVEDAIIVLVKRDSENEPWPAFSGRTDSSGLARLPGATQPKSGDLLAVREGNSVEFVVPPVTKKKADKSSVMIISLRGSRRRGSVVSAADGRPIPGARLLCSRGAFVHLSPSSNRSPLWFPGMGFEVLADRPATMTFTDDHGRFELTLPEWCKDVYVEGPRVAFDAAPWQSLRVVSSELSASEPSTIRLERGSSFLVRVSGANSPWSGSGSISIRHPGSPGDAVSSTFSGGSGRLVPAGRGPWLVLAKVPGKAPAMEGPLYAEPGKVTNVSLVLEDGAFFRVLLPPGRSASPDVVRVIDSRRRDWSGVVGTTALAGGEGIRVGPLPLGRYKVVAGEQTATVNLRQPGREEQIDFTD